MPSYYTHFFIHFQNVIHGVLIYFIGILVLQMHCFIKQFAQTGQIIVCVRVRAEKQKLHLKLQ